MSLTSFGFVAFVLLVLLAYNVATSRRRAGILLGASYLFYGTLSIWHLLVLVFVTLVSYVGGIAIDKKRRGATLLSVVTVLLPLILFKYLNLLSGLAAQSLGVFWQPLGFSAPLGISFFTFQSVSYLVDVRRGAKSEQHLGLLALHLALFPKLLAGPIERGRDLIPQLHGLRRSIPGNIHAGAKIALWGFFCKLVVADNLGSLVDTVLRAPAEQSGASLALAFGLYAFQIYFDFLGYTNIAVGVARCFNIDLNPNFLVPYSATSLRDFWRRWHISLSTWFRDYVYIPLGGGKTRGLTRAILLLLVFALSGLWHGAALTFVAWGTFHGLAYAIEDLCRRRFSRHSVAAGKATLAISRFVRRTVVFAVVTFGWILFRSPDFNAVRIGLERIAFLDHRLPWLEVNEVFRRPDSVWFVLLLIAAVSLDASRQFRLTLERIPTSSRHLLGELAYINAFVVLLVLLGDLGVRDFTYFQF